MSYTGIYLELQETIRTKLLRDILTFEPTSHPEISEVDLSNINSARGNSENNIVEEILDSFLNGDRDRFSDKFKEVKEVLTIIKGGCDYDDNRQLWKDLNRCIMDTLKEDWNELWDDVE